MTQQITEENKMGVMGINKLLVNMSLPMMISMLVMAFYNVVDSIFVAKISENALTAVSMAFPAQSLLIAVMMGTGVGYSALVSRYLGAKQNRDANETARHAVFLSVVIFVVFAVLGLTATRTFFAWQTDDPEILAHGVSYLTICFVCCFGQCIEVVFEKLLQATGRTVLSMLTQGLGAIINIVLDPILIFGIGPFPKMGVAGAAAATVIGQIAAGILACIFCLTKNHDIKISFKGFRPKGAVIKKIYVIGVPSIIMQSIGSVMTFGMNKILMVFSSTAVAVFGVYFKLQSIIFMPVFGLNNGVVPIIAYNFGASKMDRVKRTAALAAAYAMSIMFIGLIVIQIIPDKLLMLFDASPTMMSIGTTAFRITSLSFVFAGFSIVASSVMQALGNSIPSMIVSIARQLVMLLPCAWLLSLTKNVDMVWWAFPISEIIAVVLSVYYLRRQIKIAHHEAQGTSPVQQPHKSTAV